MARQARHYRKIIAQGELLTAIQTHRDAGRTIAQCHGCFDIVHPGHIRYLEFASRQADVLIVTLTGDSDIQKSPQSPYIPEELRAESLAALEFVDAVYIDPNPTAETVLSSIKPDVYVKGREYETSRDERFLRERAVVESYGGKVIFSSGDVVFSSSALIAGLPHDRSAETARLKHVCARHDITQASLGATLRHFRGMRVGVIGDIVLDRYVFCDAQDVASESPMLALSELERRDYLGGAAIVARHAAALGAETCLFSAIGDDESSRVARRVFIDENIDFIPVMQRDDLVQKTRYLVDDSKLLKVDTGASAPLDSQSEKEASAILEQRSRSLDALIICDFGYGTVTAGLLERTLPCLRANIPIIAADVSGARGNLLHYRNVNLLCPTERELRTTLHDHDEGLSSVAHRLLSETQAHHLICTLDKRGLVVFQRPTQNPHDSRWNDRLLSEHFRSFADRCLDRLGCGDAMLTTATLALAGGASIVQAAYLGNAASAVAIAQLGNVPIARDQLASWLHARRELSPGPVVDTRIPTRVG